ncbi:MAG: hypothetical protein WBD27_04155 [Pyrinomonadaceae bacterium]
MKSEFITVAAFHDVRILDKFPRSIHSLVLCETLPKFDIKGTVVTIAHLAEARHDKAPFAINVFSCNA